MKPDKNIKRSSSIFLEPNATNTNILKMQLYKSIIKLNDDNLIEEGITELQNLIKNNDNQASLRTYIQILSPTKNLSKKDDFSTVSAKKIKVLLLGYITSIYKSNLLDPLDQPNSLLNTILRFIEILEDYLEVNLINILQL